MIWEQHLASRIIIRSPPTRAGDLWDSRIISIISTDLQKLTDWHLAAHFKPSRPPPLLITILLLDSMNCWWRAQDTANGRLLSFYDSTETCCNCCMLYCWMVRITDKVWTCSWNWSPLSISFAYVAVKCILNPILQTTSINASKLLQQWWTNYNNLLLMPEHKVPNSANSSQSKFELSAGYRHNLCWKHFCKALEQSGQGVPCPVSPVWCQANILCSDT